MISKHVLHYKLNQKNRWYANNRYNQRKCNQKTFAKRFAIPLDYDFFKYSVYLYGLREDLIVRVELNISKKVILENSQTFRHFPRT